MKPVTRARKEKSPTQLALANACLAKWVYRYIYGLKGDFLTTRGTALGIVMHACLARFVEGGSVNGVTIDDLEPKDRDNIEAYRRNRVRDHAEKIAERTPKKPAAEVQTLAEERAEKDVAYLFSEAPRRALTGLGYLPDRKNNMHVHAEVPFKLNSTIWRDPDAAVITFSDMSRVDVIACSNPPGSATYGEWTVIDHKSTAGSDSDPWAYVPTPEELGQDVQFLLYLACAMDLVGAGGMWGRWVYYYTGQKFPPQAKPVDVYLTRQEVKDRLRCWFALADRMNELIDQTHATNTLPDCSQLRAPDEARHGPDTPCFAYRKPCEYKEPCNPPPRTAEQIIQLLAPKERNENMSLETRVAQQAAAGAPQIPGTQHQPPAPPMTYAAAHAAFGEQRANDLYFGGQLVEQPTPGQVAAHVARNGGAPPAPAPPPPPPMPPTPEIAPTGAYTQEMTEEFSAQQQAIQQAFDPGGATSSRTQTDEPNESNKPKRVTKKDVEAERDALKAELDSLRAEFDAMTKAEPVNLASESDVDQVLDSVSLIVLRNVYVNRVAHALGIDRANVKFRIDA